MTDAYRIVFELIPAGDYELNIVTPYDYLFRGALMDWISSVNDTLGDDLHRTDKKGESKVLREYSLFHEPIKISKSHISQGIYQGVRFYLNIFKSELTKAVLDYLMKQQTSTIQMGPQKCVITKIQIEKIDLNKIVEESKTIKPIKSITLNFHSPTAFKQMNSNEFIHSPQPDKIYGNLLKNWNLVVAGNQNQSSNQCPKEIFNWIQKSLEVTEVNTKIASWDMGKGPTKFKGFIGRVTITVNEPNIEYESWLYVLTKFGTYSSTGSQRSAGFGHYRIEKIRFLNTQT